MVNAEFREMLEVRTAAFAINVFKMLRKLPADVATRVIAYQLGKSTSSIGANYYEANRTESSEDFIHKIAIALKEANESSYWFRVLGGLFGGEVEIGPLQKESLELRNIMQSILQGSRRSRTH